MVSFGVNIIIMLGVTLTALFIFMKAVQYTAAASRKVLSAAWCFLWSVFYAATISLIPFFLFRLLTCAANIVFVFFLIRRSFETQHELKLGKIFEITVSAYLLSFGASYVLAYLAGIFVSMPYALLMQDRIDLEAPIDSNQPVYLFLRLFALVFQLILAVLIFRIRRFRKGFPFIFNKFTIVAALFFTGIILMLVRRVHLLSLSEDAYEGYNLDIAGIFISGIGIYILTRRLIQIFQRSSVRKSTDNHFEQLLTEEQAKNKRLGEANDALRSAVHKFTHRIEAMETAFAQGNITLNDIQNLQKDWQKELSAVRGENLIPSTNIAAIDNMFHHFAKLFAADEINFSIVINGSIIYMIENIIHQDKLETLIGDHLKDAQIAVNSGINPFRSVMVILGLTDAHYEFTVFDSGIPFAVDTLERLGTERITTHADDGGSGIGFAATFETMQESGASLIIREKHPNPSDYSKSVSIRFDGQHQYIIETYRPDDFTASERYRILSC